MRQYKKDLTILMRMHLYQSSEVNEAKTSRTEKENRKIHNYDWRFQILP